MGLNGTFENDKFFTKYICVCIYFFINEMSAVFQIMGIFCIKVLFHLIWTLDIIDWNWHGMKIIKKNETKPNQTNWNETKLNETWNEAKRNRTPPPPKKKPWTHHCKFFTINYTIFVLGTCIFISGTLCNLKGGI